MNNTFAQSETILSVMYQDRGLCSVTPVDACNMFNGMIILSSDEPFSNAWDNSRERRLFEKLLGTCYKEVFFIYFFFT